MRRALLAVALVVLLPGSAPANEVRIAGPTVPTTITVDLKVRGIRVATGTAQRKGPRTTLKLKRTSAGRDIHGLFVRATIRATIRDSGGRTSRKKSRILVTKL